MRKYLFIFVFALFFILGFSLSNIEAKSINTHIGTIDFDLDELKQQNPTLNLSDRYFISKNLTDNTPILYILVDYFDLFSQSYNSNNTNYGGIETFNILTLFRDAKIAKFTYDVNTGNFIYNSFNNFTTSNIIYDSTLESIPFQRSGSFNFAYLVQNGSYYKYDFNNLNYNSNRAKTISTSSGNVVVDTYRLKINQNDITDNFILYQASENNTTGIYLWTLRYSDDFTYIYDYDTLPVLKNRGNNYYLFNANHDYRYLYNTGNNTYTLKTASAEQYINNRDIFYSDFSYFVYYDNDYTNVKKYNLIDSGNYKKIDYDNPVNIDTIFTNDYVNIYNIDSYFLSSGNQPRLYNKLIYYARLTSSVTSTEIFSLTPITYSNNVWSYTDLGGNYQTLNFSAIDVVSNHNINYTDNTSNLYHERDFIYNFLDVPKVTFNSTYNKNSTDINVSIVVNSVFNIFDVEHFKYYYKTNTDSDWIILAYSSQMIDTKTFTKTFYDNGNLAIRITDMEGNTLATYTYQWDQIDTKNGIVTNFGNKSFGINSRYVSIMSGLASTNRIFDTITCEKDRPFSDNTCFVGFDDFNSNIDDYMNSVLGFEAVFNENYSSIPLESSKYYLLNYRVFSDFAFTPDLIRLVSGESTIPATITDIDVKEHGIYKDYIITFQTTSNEQDLAITGIQVIFSNLRDLTNDITNNFKIGVYNSFKVQQYNHEPTENDINNFYNKNTLDGISKGNPSDFFSSFSINDFGLSTLVRKPLDILNYVTTEACSPIEIPFPNSDQVITLPCLQSVLSDKLGILFTIIQTIFSGLILYRVGLGIFSTIKNLINPKDDKVEVIDL